MIRYRVSGHIIITFSIKREGKLALLRQVFAEHKDQIVNPWYLRGKIIFLPGKVPPFGADNTVN
ncbi:hypothetical protein A6J64_003970 [Yersinia enterocolitica]|nr:hypothetical protein YWA314_05134 [Yersinia enterocolitica subsp. enterocolitica WA-314]PNM11355.1 hypothetical protein A6J64_003970 [Yersinia enterocolitica]PNM17042.1 hypothetical protein A6J63_014860 [Yersinia enterocolitica]PNM18244.1 hypothetical protein A6J65_004685 [Yersinia enterocolitica]RLY99993.1 hypothetical protein COO51_10190 [Yersinia enterocolitica]